MRKLPTGQGRYLEHRTSLRVRFNEVDALRVAWHGHYLAWFEVGREAFGRAHGLGYADMIEADVVAPVVHIECQYARPARLGDDLEIIVRLHERRAAKLEFSYRVIRPHDGAELARGRSTQVFTDLSGALCINRPPLLEAFMERHERAWLPNAEMKEDDPPRR